MLEVFQQVGLSRSEIARDQYARHGRRRIRRIAHLTQQRRKPRLEFGVATAKLADGVAVGHSRP